MSLPEIIEITPLRKPVRAVVTVPGSKSITNRSLILAALGEGETILKGALWSEDTQVMVECLQELGFMVNVQSDPDNLSNRTITVYGKSGVVPAGGSRERPLELAVGNAGTAARFLAAFVCLGRGTYLLDGVPRMRERPQAALFAALRQLGYRIEAERDRLPALILGEGPKQGECTVSIEESSQFASALLLSSKAGGWRIQVHGESAEESPYVAMTSRLMETFPEGGGTFLIEPDASSGSYFWAAGPVAGPGNSVQVAAWPTSGWQVDERFPQVLRHMLSSERELEISRISDLGDSIMTAIVLAPFAKSPVRFTELGRLRLQECERVAALRTELQKCGGLVEEEGDSLLISPGQLRGAEIETYNDHRMAMCFSILGLRVPGLRIRNPACVKKTFPAFYQKLSAAAPAGVGAEVLELSRGTRLTGEDLFAD